MDNIGINDGSEYVNNLFSVVRVVFDSMGGSEENKMLVAKKFEKTLFIDFFAKVEKFMSAEDIDSFKKIVGSDSDTKVKFDLINNLLFKKVSNTEIINTALNVLEDRVKALVIMARDTLTGENKEKFLTEINNIFEE